MDFELPAGLPSKFAWWLDDQACHAEGLDFLTILGEHEGEGLVADADAEVAGSRSAHMADKGQKVAATTPGAPLREHLLTDATLVQSCNPGRGPTPSVSACQMP